MYKKYFFSLALVPLLVATAFISEFSKSTLSIHDNVLTGVRSGIFEKGEELTSITIPDSIVAIGESAFSDCRSLQEVYIPDSVRYIGGRAFAWCSSLERIEIPEGVLAIQSYTFSGCSSLVNVLLPNSLKKIGQGAFSGCESLNELVIPDSVMVCEDNAFAGCEYLSDVQLFDKLIEIGTNAFHNTPWLGKLPFDEYGCQYNKGVLLQWSEESAILKMREGTRVICGSIFMMEHEKIDLPNSILNIGMYFGTGSEIVNGKLLDDLVSVGDHSFIGSKINIEEFILPNGLERIGDGAFLQCEGFKTVVVPESVKVMGNGVFEYSKDLKTIKLPKHLKGTFSYNGKAKIM